MTRKPLNGIASIGFRTLVIVAAAGFASVACLTKETSNTLYLDPDGAVTWSILHRNVRSGDVEELEYFSAVVRDDHGVARWFRKLDGDVATTILRAVRPYSVLTEARFAGIDFLGQRILDSFGARGTSTIGRNPDGSVTWRLVLDMSSEPAEHNVEHVEDLFDGDLKLVLTEGRFLAAEGFTIAGDEAVMAEPEEADDEQPNVPFVISLTWTTRRK
jgi:hypothetical protein